MTSAENTFLQEKGVNELMHRAVKHLGAARPDGIGAWLATYFKQPATTNVENSDADGKWLLDNKVPGVMEKATADLVAAKPADPASWLQKYFENKLCDGGIGDIEEVQPKIFCRGPIPYEVEAGKKYFWCSCGYSQNQPFCDGSHNAINKQHGSKFFPKAFSAEKSETVLFCGCRRSEEPPICDGTHIDIEGEGGRDPIVFEFSKYNVEAAKHYNHDTVHLTLKMIGGKMPKMDASYHFSIRAGGKSRPYTPIAIDFATGTVEFLIKKIEGGAVSPILFDLKAGEQIEMKGPSPGEFEWEKSKYNRIFLIGGGSGLTPLLQTIEAAIKDDCKTAEFHLLYGNKTAADILWKTEMDALQGKNPSIFKSITHCISRGEAPSGPNFVKGRITKDGISSKAGTVTEKDYAILCGLPEFNMAMIRACKELGFHKDKIIQC
eukprot:TRINITY_DN1572_c3_g1_i1.p1 TRINITY_DN1572_c3_g1~~TRINITY_DN1572_c3_g1_i1.p1  ORF type:complete len:448 (+),score=123.13 TRINITY_DN1572_c3_g1_i1:42-1346(+)